MSIITKADELPILLEAISDERDVKINKGIWLIGVTFCFLVGLCGLRLLQPNILESSLFKVYLWKWILLGLGIILGGLVSNLVVKFILYLLTLNRFFRVRVLFFVTEEKNPLRRFFWSIIVFLVGYSVMHKTTGIETEIQKNEYVIMTLLISMIGCFAWLTMSLLLKLQKITCLKKIYFDRVRKSVLEQCILRMLMSSSPECLNKEISTFNDLSQLKKEDVTARIMDKLISMVEDGSLPSMEVVVIKRILQNIIELGSSISHVESIKKFLSEQRALTISIFQGDEISENALHLWVVSVYKNRRTLVSDMKKTNIAIQKQHLVVRLAVVVGVGVILIINTWNTFCENKTSTNNEKFFICKLDKNNKDPEKIKNQR